MQQNEALFNSFLTIFGCGSTSSTLFAGVESDVLASDVTVTVEFAPDELASNKFAPDELAPDALVPDELVPDGLVPVGLVPHGLGNGDDIDNAVEADDANGDVNGEVNGDVNGKVAGGRFVDGKFVDDGALERFLPIPTSASSSESPAGIRFLIFIAYRTLCEGGGVGSKLSSSFSEPVSVSSLTERAKSGPKLLIH